MVVVLEVRTKYTDDLSLECITGYLPCLLLINKYSISDHVGLKTYDLICPRDPPNIIIGM